jgi:hypothetical protein
LNELTEEVIPEVVTTAAEAEEVTGGTTGRRLMYSIHNT